MLPERPVYKSSEARLEFLAFFSGLLPAFRKWAEPPANRSSAGTNVLIFQWSVWKRLQAGVGKEESRFD